jgi:Major tropism determinant N-terminal domain
MSLRIRRGTNAERLSITFDLGEVVWTSDTHKMYVGDGVTIGGYGVLDTLSTVATSGSYADLTNKPTLSTVATSGSYADLTNKPTLPTLATVATSGSYNDLISTPTIPAAQVQTDWNAVSGMGVLLNKPTLSTVATSGSYNDLSNKPTIPSAQVAVDWNAATGITAILNKPTLSIVATSGSYNDLSDKPSTYSLPIASSSVLGGVKQGVNTSIDINGSISSSTVVQSDLNPKLGASLDLNTNSVIGTGNISITGHVFANVMQTGAYTNAAARDAAIATPFPGMIVYLIDSDGLNTPKFQGYVGGATPGWVNLG